MSEPERGASEIDEPIRVHFARTENSGLDEAIVPFEGLARYSRRSVVVGSPAEADLILFTQAHLCPDPFHMSTLFATEAWQRFPARCFVIDWRDRPWCGMPGLYASMPRQHRLQQWQRPWVYPWIRDDDLVTRRSDPAPLLFSFVGAATHGCRTEIFNLNHSRGVVRNSRDDSPSSHDPIEFRRSYVDDLVASRFVLCPRGHGTSSFRLQETLAAGRVPVVISDGWDPPTGPPWNDVIVRCEERKVKGLIEHLKHLEPDYERRRTSAARHYDNWFRREVMFDRMLDELRHLLAEEQGRFPAQGKRNVWYWRLRLAGLLRGT